MGKEGAAAPEGGEVFGFVVGRLVAPALEHDALPFEGEGADGAGVAFAAGDLGFEVEFGPLTVESGLAGVLKASFYE